MVRHGEIDANTRHVYAGRSDDPLNVTGRLQAIAVAQTLQDLDIGALYSSPLRRTMETANIIGQHISRQTQVSEAFNELAMGPWEGLSEAAVAERYPNEFDTWTSRPAELQIPGRETLLELQQRVLAGVLDIQYRASCTSCVAVVSHVAVIRVLLLWAENRELNDYKRVHVPNATPLELSFPD